MKSTKVQHPRRIPRIKLIMGVYWPLPGQLSLLRGLAASVYLVWGKAEPAIYSSFQNNPPRCAERGIARVLCRAALQVYS